MIRRAVWRSSFRSFLFARVESSIVQAKLPDHFCQRVRTLLASLDPFGNLHGRIVILQIIDAVLDKLAQIIGFVRPVRLASASMRDSSSGSSLIVVGIVQSF